MIKLWDQFWFRSESPIALGLFRIIFFLGGTTFVAIHVSPSGIVGLQKIWQPVSFYQLFPGPLDIIDLKTLYILWIVFSCLAAFGLFYRWTSVLAFLSALVFLGHEINFGEVDHSVHLYIMTAGIMCFSKAGDAFSFKKVERVKSWHYRWPLTLIRTYVAWIFLTCGLTKLYYGGGLNWAFSESLSIRMFLNPFPTEAALWLFSKPIIVTQLLAALALIFVELLAPLSLLNKRFGVLYFFIWTSFHVGVSLLLGGHKLFFSQVFVYVAFLPLEEMFRLFTKNPYEMSD